MALVGPLTLVAGGWGPIFRLYFGFCFIYYFIILFYSAFVLAARPPVVSSGGLAWVRVLWCWRRAGWRVAEGVGVGGVGKFVDRALGPKTGTPRPGCSRVAGTTDGLLSV